MHGTLNNFLWANHCSHIKSAARQGFEKVKKTIKKKSHQHSPTKICLHLRYIWGPVARRTARESSHVGRPYTGTSDGSAKWQKAWIQRPICLTFVAGRRFPNGLMLLEKVWNSHINNFRNFLAVPYSMAARQSMKLQNHATSVKDVPVGPRVCQYVSINWHNAFQCYSMLNLGWRKENNHLRVSRQDRHLWGVAESKTWGTAVELQEAEIQKSNKLHKFSWNPKNASSSG